MHCRRRFFFGKNGVPGIFMPCVCVMHCRRRFFFGKNGVPGNFATCNSPVAVFLRAAGAFFSARMTFLRFLWHVVALLRSSYVSQAFFSCKKNAPSIFKTCHSPVGVFVRAASAFFSGKQWLTNGFGYICDGRGIIEAHPLKGLDSQMAPALAIASLWYKRLSPSKGGGFQGVFSSKLIQSIKHGCSHTKINGTKVNSCKPMQFGINACKPKYYTSQSQTGGRGSQQDLCECRVGHTEGGGSQPLT